MSSHQVQALWSDALEKLQVASGQRSIQNQAGTAGVDPHAEYKAKMAQQSPAGAEIKSAIDQLALTHPKHAQVVRMKDIDKLPFVQIAQQLGLANDNVAKGLWNTGRKHLEKLLGRSGAEYAGGGVKRV